MYVYIFFCLVLVTLNPWYAVSCMITLCIFLALYSYLFPPQWYEYLWLVSVVNLLYLFLKYYIAAMWRLWVCIRYVRSIDIQWNFPTVWYIGTCSKLLHGRSLLNNLILRISRYHFFIMALTNVSIKLGRHIGFCGPGFRG